MHRKTRRTRGRVCQNILALIDSMLYSIPRMHLIYFIHVWRRSSFEDRVPSLLECIGVRHTHPFDVSKIFDPPVLS